MFMPERWETDSPLRRSAAIPGRLERKTKPQLAIGQIGRLLDAGLPAKWAAYDEVYGRSGELRRFCESRGLAYVAVIPRDFRITVPSGTVIKAEDAAGDAVFERRSCGNGAKGPRLADWALTRHRQPAAPPAHPPPALPPGQPGLLPVLVPAGHPGDHDVFHHHRRPQVASSSKRSRPGRTHSAGTSPRCAPGYC